MKILVLTENHPRSEPFTYGLMECQVEGSMISTGDYLATADVLRDVLKYVPIDHIEVANPLVNMAVSFSTSLFADPEDLP